MLHLSPLGLQITKHQGLVVIGGFEAFHSVLQLSENRYEGPCTIYMSDNTGLMIYITLGTSTKHSESQWLSFLPQSLTMFQVSWILETSQWIQTWSGWWNQQLSNRHGLLSWRRYSIERNNWDLRQVISNISDSGNNDHCLTFQDSTISTGNKKEGFHCGNHGRWNISF